MKNKVENKVENEVENIVTKAEESQEKEKENGEEETYTTDEMDDITESERTELAPDAVLTPFIPSAGRTKRYLQEKKMVRGSQIPEKATENKIENKNLKNNFPGPWTDVDSVFCNFPWGENIFEYFNETENILKILGSELNSGCECAFITKQQLNLDLLRLSGFSVREIIPIGDENEKDKGRKQGSGQGQGQGQGQGKGGEVSYLKGKKESNRGYGNDNKGGKTGDCFITFAVVD